MNRKTLIIGTGVVALLIIGVVKLYYSETARMEKMKEKYPAPITAPKQLEKNKRQESQTVTPVSRPSYSIIKQDALHDIKCSMDIRLKNKVTEPQLRNIAIELKSSLDKDFERIFIVYYLPDMQVGNGGWATTHFNPELEVRILGLTIEQEDKILKYQSVDNDKKIIGRWIDETPYMGSVMTLYQKSNKIYLEKTYSKGSIATEMKIQKIKGQERYVEAEGNDFGEYYLVDGRGNLSVYDNQGLIFTAIKK